MCMCACMLTGYGEWGGKGSRNTRTSHTWAIQTYSLVLAHMTTELSFIHYTLYLWLLIWYYHLYICCTPLCCVCWQSQQSQPIPRITRNHSTLSTHLHRRRKKRSLLKIVSCVLVGRCLPISYGLSCSEPMHASLCSGMGNLHSAQNAWLPFMLYWYWFVVDHVHTYLCSRQTDSLGACTVEPRLSRHLCPLHLSRQSG